MPQFDVDSVSAQRVAQRFRLASRGLATFVGESQALNSGVVFGVEFGAARCDSMKFRSRFGCERWWLFGGTPPLGVITYAYRELVRSLCGHDAIGESAVLALYGVESRTWPSWTTQGPST